MEKKIEFDAEIESVGPDQRDYRLMIALPHQLKGQGLNKVHVTLSPAQSQEPDYKAMWEELEYDLNGIYSWCLSTRSDTLKSILKKIQAKHTPQGDQVKKEET